MILANKNLIYRRYLGDVGIIMLWKYNTSNILTISLGLEHYVLDLDIIIDY